jgi:polyphosphate kinase
VSNATPRESLPLLDRDLSWLDFNRRVLHEAEDERTPLLERLKFLAIVSSNLDEFFMKRVELLTHRWTAEAASALPGQPPSRQQKDLRDKITGMVAAQASAYSRTIRPSLAEHGIFLLDWEELTDPERRQAEDLFRRTIYPVLTPLVVDPSHPFPFLSNLSQSLGVLLRDPDSTEPLFARVKVPTHLPQWLRLQGEGPGGEDTQKSYRFARLLDVLRANLGALFPGMQLLEVMPFRVTRNAEIEGDDDNPEENLVEQVEEELRQRRLEKVVRLEYGAPQSPDLLELLTDKLGLDDWFVFEAPAELDFTGLFPIAGLPLPELRDRPWVPVTTAAFADSDRSVFSLIHGGDVLVHHPYESFDATVARFVRSACEDPKVLAIKMTVYRIGSDTPFIKSLVRAAEAGKQVACLVEVTARFDEAQNLHWARVLDKVGIHVVYGVVGLKTHSKTTLVVRSEGDDIRCYAHIGTGNYHIKTARLYTDLSFLTCDSAITADVVDLFHTLTGRSRNRDTAKLLVAPLNMRERFLALIEREIGHCQAGRPARIIAKMNQLEDRGMCEALVRASRAGVPIDLIVRGFCVLPPGVRGLTERVRVLSIIGRFLEHSRIYYFQNGDDDPLRGEYFIGSADWMERNLSRRVEAITPIEAPPLRQRLWQILQVMLRDHRQAWDMQSDGSYVQRVPPADAAPDSPERIGTQDYLMALALRADSLPHSEERGGTQAVIQEGEP